MQILTVAQRVIQQVLKDKRTLMFLLFAPVLVLSLLYFIIGSASEPPTIGVVNLEETFEKALAEEASVKQYHSEAEALAALKNRSIDAYFLMNGQKPFLKMEGADITKNAPVQQAVQKALASYQSEQAESFATEFASLKEKLAAITEEGKQEINIPKALTFMEKPEVEFLYLDEEADLFEQIAPALMGFFIFLFVFLIAGISFLRERTSGTLERTLATPLKRSSIVFGYFLGFFVFVIIQTVIIQMVIVDVLEVERLGSYSLLLMTNLIIATVALSLGLLLSTFARTELQLLQFIPIAVIPQFFFSGIFDLTNAPTWLSALSKVMPLSYATDALQNIMIRGYTFTEVAVDIIVLMTFTGVFILLNMLVLKRQRAA